MLQTRTEASSEKAIVDFFMARTSTRNQGMFPCEAEIARRLSQTPGEWKAKATILERAGLPKIDPLMGGRPWPAVEAFFLRRYALSAGEVMAPAGFERLDLL